ncbi:MAG: WD40/YVTN/BNR-like repeat-containing protein, partial [Burkholderiales bacterium]
IRINPLDDLRVFVLTTTIQVSVDGGHTFKPGGMSYEGGLDFHAMWFDPRNHNRFYLGKDKGLTLTHDGGASFVFFENMPIGQFYAIGVDLRDPYYVYGGTQDNGSWGGPSFSRDVRGTQNDNWWKLHWGDGMFAQVDPSDWRKVYTEAENGSFRRYDALTRRAEPARPTPRNIVNYRDYAPSGAPPVEATLPAKFRFNWRSPMLLSPHNPQTLFLGGNYLFRTVDGGRHWQILSPDLSTNDPVKTNPNSGGLTRDVSGAETHCTITAISESPRVPGLLWVGTDDGNVQLTRDGGATWTNVRTNIVEVPAGLWVSSIEASHFDHGTAYVTFDGHRSDDYNTWLFRTTDYGKTWAN